MNNIRCTSAAAIAIAAFAGTASASMTPGQPITLTQESAVSVQFVSQSAGARGSLYFLGAESGGVMTSAASSDANNLGMFLFENHGASPSDITQLGEFAAGTTLQFAYLITNGVFVAPTGSLFRTDDPVSTFNFAVGDASFINGSSVTRVGIEDIQNPAYSDFDYNDIVFDVRMTAVPAPGSIALAMAGGAMFIRRRKSEPNGRAL
ncbi:DUF4114 domain-containing protein [Planctomycetaceae bacterium AH-315-I19]|nr:DUF4114 domain-containing protein [Planctomycetaceae bacterium AH-315-I19]